MNKPWKVVLAFTAIFLAGAIFGGLLMARLGPRLAQKRGGPPPPPSPMMLRHFSERLDLTPAQKEKIRPLVERAEDEVRTMRQTSLKDTGVILRRIQQEIAAELTPDQRKKLERMQVRQRELMREDRPILQKMRERKDRAGEPQGPGVPPPPPPKP